MNGVDVAATVSGLVLAFALAMIALGVSGRALTRNLSDDDLRSAYWRWDRAVLARRLIPSFVRLAIAAAVATVLFAVADAILDRA